MGMKELVNGVKLKISKEIVDEWDSYAACLQCRDECIVSLFKAKRAIYYGKEAEKARKKFWRLIYELYPEVEGNNLSYDAKSETVTLKLSEDE